MSKEIKAVFTADTKGFKKGVGEINSSMDTLKNTIRGIGAIAGISALTASIKNMAEKADSMQKLSDRIGVTADELQTLNAFARQGDMSFESLESSITGMIKTMGTMTDLSKDQSSALRILKLDTKSLQQMNSAERYKAIMIALAGVTSQTARESLAIKLLGKNAKESFALISMGQTELKKKFDEASKSIKISAEAQASFAEFNEQMREAGALIEALTMDTLAPSVKVVVEEFKKARDVLKQMQEDGTFQKWGEELKVIVKQVSGIFSNLMAFFHGKSLWHVLLDLAVLRNLAKAAGKILSSTFDEAFKGSRPASAMTPSVGMPVPAVAIAPTQSVNASTPQATEPVKPTPSEIRQTVQDKHYNKAISDMAKITGVVSAQRRGNDAVLTVGHGFSANSAMEALGRGKMADRGIQSDRLNRFKPRPSDLGTMFKPIVEEGIVNRRSIANAARLRDSSGRAYSGTSYSSYIPQVPKLPTKVPPIKVPIIPEMPKLSTLQTMTQMPPIEPPVNMRPAENAVMGFGKRTATAVEEGFNKSVASAKAAVSTAWTGLYGMLTNPLILAQIYLMAKSFRDMWLQQVKELQKDIEAMTLEGYASQKKIYESIRNEMAKRYDEELQKLEQVERAQGEKLSSALEGIEKQAAAIGRMKSEYDDLGKSVQEYQTKINDLNASIKDDENQLAEMKTKHRRDEAEAIRKTADMMTTGFGKVKDIMTDMDDVTTDMLERLARGDVGAFRELRAMGQSKDWGNVQKAGLKQMMSGKRTTMTDQQQAQWFRPMFGDMAKYRRMQNKADVKEFGFVPRSPKEAEALRNSNDNKEMEKRSADEQKKIQGEITKKTAERMKTNRLMEAAQVRQAELQKRIAKATEDYNKVLAEAEKYVNGNAELAKRLAAIKDGMLTSEEKMISDLDKFAAEMKKITEDISTAGPEIDKQKAKVAEAKKASENANKVADKQNSLQLDNVKKSEDAQNAMKEFGLSPEEVTSLESLADLITKYKEISKIRKPELSKNEQEMQDYQLKTYGIDRSHKVTPEEQIKIDKMKAETVEKIRLENLSKQKPKEGSKEGIGPDVAPESTSPTAAEYILRKTEKDQAKGPKGIYRPHELPSPENLENAPPFKIEYQPQEAEKSSEMVDTKGRMKERRTMEQAKTAPSTGFYKVDRSQYFPNGAPALKYDAPAQPPKPVDLTGLGGSSKVEALLEQIDTSINNTTMMPLIGSSGRR